MELHRLPLQIRFGDCDPAGVTYYPRYFDWWHQAMESWFASCLGVPYATVLRDWKVGFPAVETAAKYQAPCVFGDHVFVETRIAKVGTSSLRFAYTVVGADQKLRAVGHTSTVCIVLDPGAPRHFKPTGLPASLREAAQTYAESHPVEP